ncbi:MAG: ABC transporter ATP-binding protein [Vicingaceae bacterium]
MIQIEDLHKAFDDKEILKGISFTFERGKTNLIIGASGSGKSVLIKCIVGLFPINKGKIFYDGRAFTNLNFKEKKAIRSEIGMLFQGGALFDSYTVRENVKFPLQMHSKMTNKEMEKRVDFCLERVELAHAGDKYPSEISGGMQKRVGIARAIALNPKYLFCDEPNSGLDPQTSIVIDNLIREITVEYNITTIVVTHDMNSVMEIGDNILFLYQGKAVWTGNSKNILHSDNDILNNFVYASKIMKKFKGS